MFDQGAFLLKFCQNVCNEVAVNGNFHFFPLKVNDNYKLP